MRVPQRNRIGEEGKGFTYQMMQFQEERLWAGARGLIGLERLIEETIEYTRNRVAFGKPILDNQVVHFRLAELASEVELLRSAVYRACAGYINGQDVTKLASMIKLKSRAAVARGHRRLPAVLGRHGLHERDAGVAARFAIRGSARSAAGPTRSC